MKKRLISGLLALTLMAGAVTPAFAAVTSEVTKGNGTTYVKTDNYQKYVNYPCWIWWQGYCYYYENAGSYLTNCVTPDGYTVDEYGRWTENGVAVHNSFGSVKVGTDEYLGKSSNEVWNIMSGKLIDAFKTSIVNSGDEVVLDANGINKINVNRYAYGYDADTVWTDFDTSLMGRGETYVMYDNSGYNTFVTATIGGGWSDEESNVYSSLAKAAYSNKPDMKEKVIKAVVGDNIGTELFNYINQHANKKTSGYRDIIDENGNRIKGWNENVYDENGNLSIVFTENPNGKHYKKEYVSNVGDGINASELDLSMWQNRTTDYGKAFSVVAQGDALLIHVYN